MKHAPVTIATLAGLSLLAAPPTQGQDATDGCVESKYETGIPRLPERTGRKGVPFTGDNECILDALIGEDGLMAKLEAACSSLPSPDSGTEPASKQLQDIKDSGNLCFDNSDWANQKGDYMNTFYTRRNGEFPWEGDKKVRWSGAPAIHVNAKGLPKPDSDGNYPISCEGGGGLTMNAGEMVKAASKLFHELHHFNEHEDVDPVPSTYQMEKEATEKEYEYLCAVAGCDLDAAGITEGDEMKKAACERINEAFQVLCKTVEEENKAKKEEDPDAELTPKPEPPECAPCEDLGVPIDDECNCEDDEDGQGDDDAGGGESVTPPDAPPVYYEPDRTKTEHPQSLAYSGLITLYVRERHLLIDVTYKNARIRRNIRFDAQEPLAFQPIDFFQVSSSLVLLSGYSTETGDGMVVGVHYSVPTGMITLIDVMYEGTGFLKGDSIAAVPGSSTDVVILDSIGAEIVKFDLRNKSITPLFNANSFPSMIGKTRVHTSLSYDIFGNRVILFELLERSSPPWSNLMSSTIADPGYAQRASGTLLIDTDLDLIADEGP